MKSLILSTMYVQDKEGNPPNPPTHAPAACSHSAIARGSSAATPMPSKRHTPRLNMASESPRAAARWYLEIRGK